MIDSSFRSLYQKFLIDPFLSLPFAKKLSPMKATFIGLLLGVSVAPLLAFHFSWAAIVCLVISGYFDTLDGSLARAQKKASSLGAVFDITSDRLVEFSVIFGLFLYNPALRAIPSFLMLGSVLLCITSFLVVGVFSQNQSEKSFHYSFGIMERTEAFIFWTVMILFPQTFSFLAYTFTFLVFLTTVIRLFQFSKQTTCTK